MRAIRRLVVYACLSIGGAAAAQVPDNTYDGFWTGQWTCSEALMPNMRHINGFTHPVSVFVASRSGRAKFENATDVTHFEMTIAPDSTVSLQASGVRKEDSGGWAIRTSGRLDGDGFAVHGPMTKEDGQSTLRARCEVRLHNTHVQARLDELRRPRAAAALPTPVPIATSSPQPVEATPQGPARTAALGNVSPSGNSVKQSLTKVTPNPVDSMRKTSAADVWINFNPAITVQERQFCRIVESFRGESRAAEKTRNQIKVNETIKNFSQAVNALLPDGKFQGWVMRSVSVAQASDGSADVIFELPCNVYVGSNTCDTNPQKFYGTIAEGSRIYSELSKISVNDFALVSGQFVYPDDNAFERTRSVVSYGYLKTAAHCKAKVMTPSADFFGATLHVLSTIK